MATARHLKWQRLAVLVSIRLFGTVANICSPQYRSRAMKYLAVLLLLTTFALAEEPTDFQLATRGTEALKAGLTDPWSMKLSMVTVYKRPTKGKVFALSVWFSIQKIAGGDITAMILLASSFSPINLG